MHIATTRIYDHRKTRPEIGLLAPFKILLAEDVKRAHYAAELYGNARPDVILEESMLELLNHYQFYKA